MVRLQASNSRFRTCITVVNIPSLADIIDQPRVVPPAGFNYRNNRDWPRYTLDPDRKSYGFSYSLALGLARPNLGLLNAENYAVFAMCLAYQTLDCITDIMKLIARGESVPFQPAPEAVKQIRQGRSTMLREHEKMQVGRDLDNTSEQIQ